MIASTFNIFKARNDLHFYKLFCLTAPPSDMTDSTLSDSRSLSNCCIDVCIYDSRCSNLNLLQSAEFDELLFFPLPENENVPYIVLRGKTPSNLTFITGRAKKSA